MRSTRFVLAALTALATSTLPARADQVLRLDPAACKVSFTLPATGHDVHGVLAVKSGEVTFDLPSGRAAGELVVDATSGETGNSSRDKKMHGEVLESEKFPLFVFKAEGIKGALAPGDNRVTLSGKLAIHGSEHPFELPATVRLEGETLRGTATFAVPFVAWGMNDPGILFLRVGKEVAVTVELAGRLEASSASAQAGPGR